MLTGLYVPGDSWLHRARPGVELGALLALTTMLVVWASPWSVLAGAAGVTAAGLSAGLGARRLFALVRPLKWVVLLLTPLQWWTGGWAQAVVVVGGLVVAVAGAGLVTATTRTSELADSVLAALGPLRRLGVDTERIALAVALVLRSVPVVAAALEQARQARVARGLERSPRALLVPVVVRTVRHAQGVGDALVARGVDD